MINKHALITISRYESKTAIASALVATNFWWLILRDSLTMEKSQLYDQYSIQTLYLKTLSMFLSLLWILSKFYQGVKYPLQRHSNLDSDAKDSLRPVQL